MVALLPARLDAAEVYRGQQRLLGPLSWDLSASGLSVVIGPNGAGKTSLLKAMHGLERLSRGRMIWPVPQEQARAAQAFVFQTPVVMRRSVIDNVAYPLRLRGASQTQARVQATAWLACVGLTDKARRRANTLSGGERQKMALARALITEPQLVFLDEPCSNLDGRATREIEALLIEARTRGTRIVMATHDMGQARRLADEVVFLHRGHIVETGSATGFFDTPQTPQARAFLNGDILE